MKLYAENLCEKGKNQYIFRKKGGITLGGIYKKNATVLEISLLKNCKKLSSASPQNWSSFYQKIT